MKDLSIDLALEAAELMEPFRFKTEKQVSEITNDEKKREYIKDELSDILYALLLCANEMNLDLARAFEEKLEKLEKKYPVEKSRGKNPKWNEYE
ncbi:nucleotide pyrophosphohydrolase [Candidatus Micrarchaeota archaeon]|nr:nucleotide pyrophosphohydrolase [Candidatus Micrarchaeota archaeon]